MPMPVGQLRVSGWKELAAEFPDQDVVSAILGICKFGARIGYMRQRTTPTIYNNLATAGADISIVSANISLELSKHRLNIYPNVDSLPAHYTASPLGLTDMADGSKRRIHHLSYPPTGATSINSEIPER